MKEKHHVAPVDDNNILVVVCACCGPLHGTKRADRVTRLAMRSVACDHYEQLGDEHEVTLVYMAGRPIEAADGYPGQLRHNIRKLS